MYFSLTPKAASGWRIKRAEGKKTPLEAGESEKREEKQSIEKGKGIVRGGKKEGGGRKEKTQCLQITN